MMRFLTRGSGIFWDGTRACAGMSCGGRSAGGCCESLQKLVPEIQPEDLETGGAGVRAQAITPQGELVQDFHFVEQLNAIHVLNAPSPGATASLAIGEEIVARLRL